MEPEIKPKRKKSTSPTQRSLKMLREAGFVCGITEHWNPHVMIRQDLFGFIDILALAPGIMLAVQTTSSAHAADRVAKILAEPRALNWLEAGGRIVVHAWAKRGPRGEVKRWSVVERPVTILEDFPGWVAGEKEKAPIGGDRRGP